VLSLDAVRTLQRDGRGLGLIKAEAQRCVAEISETNLLRVVGKLRQSIEHAESWLATATKNGQSDVEAGARRFCLTTGRSLALALLLCHAQWSLEKEKDRRAMESAIRFAQNGIDLIF
jgi:hypothetical protein